MVLQTHHRKMFVIITVSQSGHNDPSQQYEVLHKAIDVDMDWLVKANPKVFDLITYLSLPDVVDSDEVIDLDDTSCEEPALIKQLLDYMQDETNLHVIEIKCIRMKACGEHALSTLATCA